MLEGGRLAAAPSGAFGFYWYGLFKGCPLELPSENAGAFLSCLGLAFSFIWRPLYLGNLTPGRAGDFAKVFYLKQDLKLSTGKGITSVLVDRVFDLYLLLVLGGLGILLNPMPTDRLPSK